MSYPNQYPPGQYDAYGAPQQQWGQPPPGAHGGYAPPPQGGYAPYGGYPQPGAPQPGYGQPPPGAPHQHAGYPPPGAPPQHGGYPPGAPPQHGGYPPPGGAYPPYGTAPPGPPAPNYGSHPGQHAYAPPAGTPPPAQPYGAPHPGQPYGAPAASHSYGAPPAPQAYGAPHPPQHAGPLTFLGVPIPPPPPAPPLQGAPPGFDTHRVVEAIRKATKGFGTDEKALTAAIAPLDAFQADAIRRAFEVATGKGLVKVIEKETSAWFEYALRAKVLGPVLFDCWLIHRACSGAGTHEDVLTEVLLDRTNSEIQIIKSTYYAVYGRDVTSIIRSELSSKTERLFNMALVGNREEGEYVDRARVDADVKTLYKAGAGQIGTDEIAICTILVARSPAHMRAVAQAYLQKHKRKLSKAIDSEFSGHMDQALQFVARGAEWDVQRDADMLEEAMAGAGTKDERLIYRTIRAHWNRARFDAVKTAYRNQYGKTLLARVRGETGGDYRDLMCAIIGN